MSVKVVDTISTVLATVGIILIILGLAFGIITAKTKHIEYMSECFVNTVIVWTVVGGVFAIASIAWDVTLLIMTFC